MSRKKPWPCKFENGSVSPCYALSEATDANWMDKRKGIFVATIVNHHDTTQKFMYGVRSGDHTKKGLMFNHCPFCGEAISTEGAKPLELETAA